MARKHMKGCMTSSVMREMKIRTAVKYPKTGERIAKIQNADATQHWQGCTRAGSPALLEGRQGAAETHQKMVSSF